MKTEIGNTLSLQKNWKKNSELLRPPYAVHTVLYSRNATRALRRIPQDHSAKIVGAIKELATCEKPSGLANVKQMKGDYAGFYRLRVGNYRAIFALDPDPNAEPEQRLFLIAVSAIGTRQGIY